MRKLVGRSILKLEAFVYMTELFPGDELVGDANSGWKPLISRKFEGSISTAQVMKFIDDVCDIIKSRKELKFVEFDRVSAAAALFSTYKCTIDSNSLGFIMRSKVELDEVDDEVVRKRKWYERVLPVDSALWLWNGFKTVYNGLLERIKIG